MHDHSTHSSSRLNIPQVKMALKLTLVFLLVCVVSSAMCQTFQYSRGWTNGKRNGLSPKETACELHRIRALLEGKPLTPYFWPCGFRQFADASGRVLEVPADMSKIPAESEEK